MLRRITNIWRPESFHLQHMLDRGSPFFEGRYFKLVDAQGSQPYAIIVIKAHRQQALGVTDVCVTPIIR
jgi:hypothetical protein